MPGGPDAREVPQPGQRHRLGGAPAGVVGGDDVANWGTQIARRGWCHHPRRQLRRHQRPAARSRAHLRCCPPAAPRPRRPVPPRHKVVKRTHQRLRIAPCPRLHGLLGSCVSGPMTLDRALSAPVMPDRLLHHLRRPRPPPDAHLELLGRIGLIRRELCTASAASPADLGPPGRWTRRRQAHRNYRRRGTCRQVRRSTGTAGNGAGPDAGGVVKPTDFRRHAIGTPEPGRVLGF